MPQCYHQHGPAIPMVERRCPVPSHGFIASENRTSSSSALEKQTVGPPARYISPDATVFDAEVPICHAESHTPSQILQAVLPPSQRDIPHRMASTGLMRRLVDKTRRCYGAVTARHITQFRAIPAVPESNSHASQFRPRFLDAAGPVEIDVSFRSYPFFPRYWGSRALSTASNIAFNDSGSASRCSWPTTIKADSDRPLFCTFHGIRERHNIFGLGMQDDRAGLDRLRRAHRFHVGQKAQRRGTASMFIATAPPRLEPTMTSGRRWSNSAWAMRTAASKSSSGEAGFRTSWPWSVR